MLKEVLDLLRAANGTAVSAAMVSMQLGIAPEVTALLLRQLVQRGRVVQVAGACAGCEICPLHRFCAGASGAVDAGSSHGYRIRVSEVIS
jgi:hypothetical protein